MIVSIARMSKCYLCQADGLEFHETLRMNINPITGQKHGPQFCKAKQPVRPISKVEMSAANIPTYKGQAELANEITKMAEAAGLDPFNPRLEYRGDYIILH